MRPEIFVGCAGSGKTAALLGLVEEELAKGTHPSRIGFLSFTRKATLEASERAQKRFGLSKSDLPWFRTIHSLAFKILGLSQGDVFDGKGVLQEFAAYAGTEITGKWSDDGTLTGFADGDRIRHMDNLARVRRIPLYRQYCANTDDLEWAEVERVIREQNRFKHDKGLLDYTDMLERVVEQGGYPALDVLIIDEAQDNSLLNWAVIEGLAQGCRRVVVAADDDQALYLWSGANVQYFIDLPGIPVMLNQSHRVRSAIQPLANRIIERVRHRRPKAWIAKPGDPGRIVRAAHFAHADMNGEDVMVLVRNNFLMREQVEPELRRRGIIYERLGHPSIRPSLMSAIISWERLRRGDSIPVEAARGIYDHMTAGKGVQRGFKQLSQFGRSDGNAVDPDGGAGPDMVTMDALKARGGLLVDGPWYEAFDRVPHKDVAYIRAALARGERLGARPRVKLSTIHGAKGGEAEHVVLLTEMAKRSHRELVTNPDDEARVWYVAVTRTKAHLTIVESRTALRCPWL